MGDSEEPASDGLDEEDSGGYEDERIRRGLEDSSLREEENTDEHAASKEEWLNTKRLEWEEHNRRRHREGSTPRKPTATELTERQAWIMEKRREWEAAQRRRQREQMEQLARPSISPAAAKRAWLREQRLEREHQRAILRPRDTKGAAPLVDASVLTSPTEREVYIRRLREQQLQSDRERRRRVGEAARRPSDAGLGSVAEALCEIQRDDDDDTVSDGVSTGHPSWLCAYSDDEHPLAGADSHDVDSVSASSSAERAQYDLEVDELELLESLRSAEHNQKPRRPSHDRQRPPPQHRLATVRIGSAGRRAELRGVDELFSEHEHARARSSPSYERAVVSDGRSSTSLSPSPSTPSEVIRLEDITFLRQR